MRLVSCQNGKLLTTDSSRLAAAGSAGGAFSSGLPEIDRLLPGRGVARGAVHEVLWRPDSGVRPLFFAAWLARAAIGNAPRTTAAASTATAGRVAWCDPRRQIYPPALAGMGIPLERLFLLHPKSPKEVVWAVAECLGCKGVSATVAHDLAPLSRIEARRLQLAAERGGGGGVGILVRPAGAASVHHAAATRWLVEPARGERTVQRWRVQLIHGHGGLLHRPVYLECSSDRYDDDHEDHNEVHRVRAVGQLADRPAAEAKTILGGA